MASNIIPDLIEFFPDVVAWKKLLTTDSGGNNPTYAATATNLQVRISNKLVVVASAGGTEHQSMLHFICAGAVGAPGVPLGLDAKDEYTLPARFADRTPEAKAVTSASDENGVHHEKVFF